MVRRKTMFFAAKHKLFAEGIAIQNPARARESIRFLNGQCKEAKTRAKLRRLIAAANLAANRAGVIAGSERTSPAERVESRQVEEIFRRWVEKHTLN